MQHALRTVRRVLQPFIRAVHADQHLDLRVIRFQIRVCDRPINQSRTRDWPNFAALDEINFVEAPEVCGEMYAGAADTAAVDKRALRLGSFIGRFANGGRLQLGMIRKLVQGHDFDFVVGEIGFCQIRTLLENHDAKTVGGKLLGQDAARGSGAHNDEVHFIRSLVFGLVCGHFLPASFASSFGAASHPG